MPSNSSESLPIDHYLIRHYIRVSKTVTQLKQVHAVLLKIPTNGSIKHRQTIGCLLSKLLCFPGDNLWYARHLFDNIPKCKTKPHSLLALLLRSHVLLKQFTEAISVYARFQQDGMPPCGTTFSSVLTACARIPVLLEGRQVHARVLQSGFLGNKVVETCLLDMYVKNRAISDATAVFDEMGEKDIVTRTAMLHGFSKMGMMSEARRLFDQMEERNIVSWSTVVAGYANIGDMGPARDLYDQMPRKDSVVWVAMISGYGKIGNVDEAKAIFDKAEVKDEKCWAAMLACYAQNGRAEAALELYVEMRKENLTVSEVAAVGAISACTQLADVKMANELAKHIEEGICRRTVYVSNALIHMHSKCGNIDQAMKEFNSMKIRDVISYTSLITALADHGKAMEALSFFVEMLKHVIKPNQITFVSVLGACSHAGLVEEGMRYFAMMTQVFGINPSIEHYSSIIDLLGRAGQLERAYSIVANGSGFNDPEILGALLGACRVHGNVEIGETVAKRLFEIEPENTGNYMLLANIYASLNRWEDAEKLKRLISLRGMRKSPGSSFL
ncbi:putative pentatricopeptide repeat-containing protein At5g37570 [Punica granatum]|uniref:Pentatricopeptide repeat-containing protein At5g37570 n=2 Tax=Punica granatum TaxID=22663 RepID=A0A6P8D662_PUNGR|nr:putative pentatricopeptide repeat-containing protein At5g37570 [Punica granatum]